MTLEDVGFGWVESWEASTAFGSFTTSPKQAWLPLIMKNNVWPGRPLGMLIFAGFVMSLLISMQSGGPCPLRTCCPVCQASSWDPPTAPTVQLSPAFPANEQRCWGSPHGPCCTDNHATASPDVPRVSERSMRCDRCSAVSGLSEGDQRHRYQQPPV